MTKYYVTSGDVREVVEAENLTSAAEIAIQRKEQEKEKQSQQIKPTEAPKK
jgi:hypothetical protein